MSNSIFIISLETIERFWVGGENLITFSGSFLRLGSSDTERSENSQVGIIEVSTTSRQKVEKLTQNLNEDDTAILWSEKLKTKISLVTWWILIVQLETIKNIDVKLRSCDWKKYFKVVDSRHHLRGKLEKFKLTFSSLWSFLTWNFNNSSMTVQMSIKGRVGEIENSFFVSLSCECRV